MHFVSQFMSQAAAVSPLQDVMQRELVGDALR